jgi:hypothetical protein
MKSVARFYKPCLKQGKVLNVSKSSSNLLVSGALLFGPLPFLSIRASTRHSGEAQVLAVLKCNSSLGQSKLARALYIVAMPMHARKFPIEKHVSKLCVVSFQEKCQTRIVVDEKHGHGCTQEFDHGPDLAARRTRGVRTRGVFGHVSIKPISKHEGCALKKSRFTKWQTSDNILQLYTRMVLPKKA